MEQNDQLNSPENPNKSSKSNYSLYALVIIVLIASIAFRLIDDYNFEQTSILFIGIPAFLAILVIKYTSTPKNIYLSVIRVITLFLLISAIFLGEGIVCVIFMAPIFYGVGALLAFLYDLFRRNKKKNLFSITVIPVLLLIAQPKEIFKAPPLQTVNTSVIVNDVVSFESFNKSPDFFENYPNFFKLGFPKPIQIEGKGTQVGDHREIEFLSTTKGIGVLKLEVIKATDNQLTFAPIRDETHINHWLTWKQMNIELIPLTNNQTEVKWTTNYYCDLGPSWYFLPFEQMAVNIMNQHLINSYFVY